MGPSPSAGNESPGGPSSSPLPSRAREARKVTLCGLLVNTGLMIIKLLTGLLIGSSALLADGFHSLSDVATDMIVLIGNRMSSRPPDESHPYGHSKFETLTAQTVALVLFAGGAGIIWTAGLSIYNRNIHRPGIFVLVVAGLSVVLKEMLYYATRKTARRIHSPALYANAWHHRSDSLSSVAVLAGGAAGLLGWGYADQVSAVVVGFIILAVSGKILTKGVVELSEHAADGSSIRTIVRILEDEEDLKGWHALRTRRLGAELFLDFHILVDADMTVKESHGITQKIERKIKSRFSRPVNILIHVDPALKD